MDKTQFLTRWLHVIAGITWIGHLYFFNLVNGPLQASIDDATKKAVNPQLQPRALWWFRWGAMVTFLTGLLLFTMIFMMKPEGGMGPNMLFRDAATGMLTDRARWIMWGALFGVIMWFNVWFIIWPINGGILRGEITGEAVAKKRRVAFLASRTNTYLSGPMLVGMLAAGHWPMGFTYGNLLILGAGALLVIAVAIGHAGRVGKTA